jgi:multidrug efflux pump subunit AcrA (membrane-fusion protein)
MITPGMSARGQLSIDTRRSGVVVPRDAILRFPDGRVTVWVIDKQAGQTVVREQRVRTGLEFDGVVEIKSGLSSAGSVVVRGNETLQDGQVVTILNEGG